jgi:hypothetical protein
MATTTPNYENHTRVLRGQCARPATADIDKYFLLLEACTPPKSPEAMCSGTAPCPHSFATRPLAPTFPLVLLPVGSQVPPGPHTPPCKGCLVYTTNAPSRCNGELRPKAVLHFRGQSHVPRGLLRSLCRRRRRRAHPPARPPYRAQCPVGYPDLPRQAPVLVCVGAAAAGVLGGAWYGFAVASRRTNEQRPRGSCLCHWGGRRLAGV